MTNRAFDFREDAVRSAVEAGDFACADAAMREYLAWFGSEPRTLAQVAAARNLMRSSLDSAVARRANLAAQLRRVTTVSTGYSVPRVSTTWRLDG
jgi:hypothetical protein